MRREIAGVMSNETALSWQVIDDKKGSDIFRGFVEVRSLKDLDHSDKKGLIITDDIYRLRYFVYDKEYSDAIDEFYRYVLQTNKGEVKDMYIMDYDLPESQVEYRKLMDGGDDIGQ